ncbi:hypothetical protein [Streptomyces sp. AF1A]|jgi:hypothetical protein|uniref:hypothetical protein n=1 Tax=Streptomyces sp. AF1A TaxID=3394350 RepID=UPI0039BC79CF
MDRATSSDPAEPVVLDGRLLMSDPDRGLRFAESAHQVLADLVREGAALGWVEPPTRQEVTELLDRVITSSQAGDGALRAAGGPRPVG